MDYNRRKFLALASLVPAALLAARSTRAADAACYDPATLPLSEKNRRRAVEFIEQSTDPERRCGLCAFFTPGQGACGTCQMLSGGPVTSAGLCNSFAAKSA